MTVETANAKDRIPRAPGMGRAKDATSNKIGAGKIGGNKMLRIAMVVLLGVSIVQVFWWFLDQRLLINRYVDQISAMYHQDRGVAETLKARGVSEQDIKALLPHINLTAEGAQMVPDVVAALDAERSRRLLMYASEGSFFILVLIFGMGIIWKALHDEAAIRRNQDNFLMLVSHEFKTPLASLQLAAETMMRRSPSPDDLTKKLQRMLSDLGRMQNMVSKILDSARLQQGRVKMQKENVNLKAAVMKAVNHFTDQADAQSIEMVSHIADDLEIYSDPMAVETVLLNIIENACDAMAPHGKGRLTIDGARHGGVVELAIRDTGTGFAPEKAAAVFGKFYRTDDTYCGDKKGTGLGLFIVERLMRLQNGRVRAQSDGPGQGATFTLVWPEPAGRSQ